MDGSPSRGETIPIRLFLGGFDLTPTFREVNKKFSTRYYLSLVLIDEGLYSRILCCQGCTTKLLLDARRYFKQSEIVLYRQPPEVAAALLAANAAQPTLPAQSHPTRAGGAGMPSRVEDQAPQSPTQEGIAAT